MHLIFNYIYQGQCSFVKQAMYNSHTFLFYIGNISILYDVNQLRNMGIYL